MRRVPLECLPAFDRPFGQLLATADDCNLAAMGALVDRERQAPIALLADHPVVHVEEPVELSLIPETGDPGDAFDHFHDLVAKARVHLFASHLVTRLVVNRAHADVPLVHETEHEGCPATPAVRVAVGNGLEPVEAMLVVQRLDDRLHYVANVAAGVRAEARDDYAALIERGDHR